MQKSGASYGVAFHPPATAENPAPDVLIPETVKRGAIEIGRFEMTRAQFAAFDKDYKFDAGTENYPANGITLRAGAGLLQMAERADRRNLSAAERKRNG